MYKYSVFILGSIFTLICCDSSIDKDRDFAEEKGRELLHQARMAYQESDYTSAISFIDSIRKTYPLAMNVREQGILLKDSVFIKETQEKLKAAMDSGMPQQVIEDIQLQVKFYLRKLEHDKEKRQTHD